MSAGMPELGSKISLISKADIRYEGRLFTVDPQECTIALASVRSFGTEERETKYPVAPQNQVYDYILFRGSDIKDIRVVNNVIPNDPAIMQLSVPPTLGPQPYQQPGFSHPILGHMGGAPQMGQYPPYGPTSTGLGPIGAGLPNSGLAPGMGIQRDPRSVSKPEAGSSDLIGPPLNSNATNLPRLDQGARSNDTASVLDLISGGGSRSTTPVSLISRKSPTTDTGVQVQVSNVQASGGIASIMGDDKKQQRPIQPPHQRQQQNQQLRGQQSRSRERQQTGGPGGPQIRNQRNVPQGGPMQQNQQHHGDNRNQNQNQNRQQGGWPNRSNMRQRGRGRGGPQGGYRPPQTQNQGGKPKNTLKFDIDYDFEQANSKFEEVKSQLKQMKLDDGSKPEQNGEVEKKDDSGNETGAGEGEIEEDHENPDNAENAANRENAFYDKSKSFFDNISCEAIERSKGRSQRTDWRTERKLNHETFGVSASKRGGYRGRGGYYSRGMGGMYRGGYRTNYRQNQQRANNNRGGGNSGPNQASGATNQTTTIASNQEQGSQQASVPSSSNNPTTSQQQSNTAATTTQQTRPVVAVASK